MTHLMKSCNLEVGWWIRKVIFFLPQEVGLVLAAILALLLAFYAFFYLRLSTDVDPDLEPDED